MNNDDHFKLYKVEQKKESLHHEFNLLEDFLFDKPQFFLLMIKEFEIRNKTDKICIPKFNT